MKKHLPKKAAVQGSIVNRIYSLRGEKVMLDRDLAEMYGVTTTQLNQAVKRNIERFPEDFMFEVQPIEWESLVTQYAIPRNGHGGNRFLPNVFTEHAVAMLSGILKSRKAIAVNIQIMRVFVNIRTLASQHRDLLRKIEKLERKTMQHDGDIQEIFQYMKNFLSAPTENENKKQIGFVIPARKQGTTAQLKNRQPKQKN